MTSLFVSHSRQDAAKTAELVSWLRGVGFQALFVDFDPNCGIPAGRNWERELYVQLQRADGVLYVASSASAASRWCFAELSLARSIGKPIFPVVVEGTERLALLSDVQWVDLAADGEQAYGRLLVGLRRAGLDPGDAFAWDPTRSPYPGLEPFSPEDAAVFFGRHAEIERLLQLLQSTLQHVAGRFVGIVGPSGSGKSSLLRAGLLPRLQRLPERWVVVPTFRPGQDPVNNLARSLAQAFAARGQSFSSAELTGRLERGAVELVKLGTELAESGLGEPNVLVTIDQAEELVTRTGARDQQRFLGLLDAALSDVSPLWVVATLRSEFLTTAPERAGLAEALDDAVVVEPLSRNRLSEVIQRPAQRAGVGFAPGLVERMVEETTGGDALPLLAYTLRELYQRVGPEGTISLTDYEAIGGVVGGLQRRADQLLDELTRRGQGQLVLPTLLKLATVEGETEPTRRRLRRGALSPGEQVVQAFVDARLLTTDSDDHEATVEVAHEALLRQWAPLRRAIEDSRAWLRLRSELEREAADWDRGRRDESYLLRGERLQAVHAALATVTRSERLEGLEREYYDASVALDQRSRQAERRRRRATVLALSIVFVVINVAAGQYRVARHEANFANSRSLAGQATPILDDKLDLGMLLSIEAWRLAPTIEARRAALAAVSRGRGIEAILRNPDDGAVAATAFSPSAPLLAVGGQDRAIRLWDLRTRRQHGGPLVLPDSAQQAAGDGVQALAFSPNGRNLAAIYNRGSIVIWRLGDGAPARPVALQHQPISQLIRLVFSRDGKILAATGLDTRIALWDVGTGRALSSPLGHAKDALMRSDVVFVDGATVVAVTGDGVLARWDVRRRIERERIQLPLNKLAANQAGKVASAAVAPDGSHVAFLINDELTVWDARTGKQLARSRRPALDVTSELVFNQGSTRLAVVTGEGSVELLDVRSLQPDGIQPPMHRALSVGFSADGTSLAVGGRGVTTLWSLKQRRPLATPLFGNPGSAALRDLSATVAFSSQDSSRLLSVANGTLRAWALPGRRPVQEVRVGGPIGLEAVAISADGSSAAFLNRDNKVSVWHLGEQRPSLTFPVDSVNSLALSADGKMLATGGDANDGRIRLWDAQHATQSGRGMRRDPARVSALAFSARGDLLASADYGQVISLWGIAPARGGTRHLQPLRPERRLVEHPGAVRSVAFDAEGKRLASAGDDEALRLWDAATGRLIGRPILPRSAINALAFAPDGRTIATATTDGGLRFWDVPTGRMLGDTQSASPRALQSVSFNAAGQQAATIDETGAILLWDRMLWSADRDAVSGRLCAIASRNLTRSEWRVFMPGEDYRPTCERWMGDPKVVEASAR